MPLIPMRDRLVLEPISHDKSPGGLHIVTGEEKNPFQKDMSTIRCRVIAEGDGMLVGEHGTEFENPFPRYDGPNSVSEWSLINQIVVVSKWAGFEYEDADRKKFLIVTPLDILAIVEE